MTYAIIIFDLSKNYWTQDLIKRKEIKERRKMKKKTH
jgi:hypothetical protein